MGKVAKRYLDIDPWIIRETGFHPDRAMASESIFSLANEFAGVRGSFDEGYTGPTLPGFYFNGIYESGPHHYSTKFKGFAERWTYMVNAVDWIHTRITLDGERLDLGSSRFEEFTRQVDMRRGILERSFVWETESGKRIRLVFERFLSMVNLHVGVQCIRFTPLNFSGPLQITAGLDFGTTYHLKDTKPWTVLRRGECEGWTAALARTSSSGHRLFAAFRTEATDLHKVSAVTDAPDRVANNLVLDLLEGRESTVEKTVVFHTAKDSSIEDEKVWRQGEEAIGRAKQLSVTAARREHTDYWARFWSKCDITILGDEENQQGFRYSIFHLHQTYHGANPAFNIGAKGLTGEHYWGVTWWDTETYCLPFYLFNDRSAARNLIEYRYRTLAGAKARAADFHLPGARYPMCTIDGDEVCDVWQHGDLEIHVSAAVAYGIWKYVLLSGDEDFLFSRGVEMLVEIARFYAARGGWGQVSGKFGFWGVMGPDEMHTMVNNNAYTNHMAKKSFEWALQAADQMRTSRPRDWALLRTRLAVPDSELQDWQHKSGHMESMLDPLTGIYEQHEGFFNLPHVDYAAIPDDQFPVQKKWPYVDLFRFDLIKQPDALLFFFLFSTEFDRASLRRNFNYYEPRCSHESSLSPSIHSILAARLGDVAKAVDYARYAARLDLDDYNNNTSEGLHVTSMAGAWMNLVYGFGGLESDGPRLRFSPVCPPRWQGFTFRLTVGHGAILEVEVSPESARFTMIEGEACTIEVFGRPLTVTRRAVNVPIQRHPPLEAVIFDLDGVIVSTDECHYLAWQRMAEEEGIDFTRDDNQRCRGVSRMESLEVVLEKAGRTYTAAEKESLAARKNGYYVGLLADLGPGDILPGVTEFVADLRSAGVKTAIGSSSRNALRILERIGLLGGFDAIVDGTDVERSKPAPDVFLLAATRLGVPPAACLVVEDAAAGVAAAVAAGMRCLGVGPASEHPCAHHRADDLRTVRFSDLSPGPIEARPAAPATREETATLSAKAAVLPAAAN